MHRFARVYVVSNCSAHAVQAVGGGFSAHYNLPQNRIMSPHNPGGYRTTSFRQSSKHRPSSAAPTITPVSPLGVPISSQFAPTPVSGPTERASTPSRAQGGTPPGDLSALSNPFSWNAEGGHSAPLPPFPDAAHKAVHDAVMKVSCEPHHFHHLCSARLAKCYLHTLPHDWTRWPKMNSKSFCCFCLEHFECVAACTREVGASPAVLHDCTNHAASGQFRRPPARPAVRRPAFSTCSDSCIPLQAGVWSPEHGRQ
jgi:hypothetical protein